MRKSWIVLFVVFLFQATFGLYYAVSEHRRGQYFDPLQPSELYFQTQILEAWKAPRAAGDLEAYNRAAYSLVTEHRLATSNGEPSAWVTPGYPIVLAALYSIFGFRYFAVLFFNAICLTLAYGLLSGVARKLFSPAAGVATLILLCLNLRISMFVGYIYTECLFILILSAALAGAVELYRNPARRWPAFVGLGLLCGYGILVRPVFLGIIPMIALFLCFRPVKSPRERVSLAITFGLISLVFVSAWVVRNQVGLGKPILSTSSSYALGEGNQDYYRQFSFGDGYRNATTQTPYGPIVVDANSAFPERDRSFALRDQFREWKERNGGFYAWLTAWRMKSLLMPFTEDMSSRNKAVSTVLWILIFPLAIVGWIRRRSRLEIWLIGLSALGLLALPALVVVGPSLRYQVPAQILLTLLAAAEFERAIPQKWRERLLSAIG